MRFHTISLKNVGVFQGHHRFELDPLRNLDGVSRPLTIVSGHNGSGKSTLFQAISLALYGPLSLGYQTSQQNYNDFLLNRLHRRRENGGFLSSNQAAVKLCLRYVESGQLLNIEIERHWVLDKDKVQESLSVSCNGKPLDVADSDYQIWLNELMPPGLSQLCFFNAEQLDALASPEQYNQMMGEMLNRLFDLDLVDRLQSDIRLYVTGQVKGASIQNLQAEVAKWRELVDEYEQSLIDLESKKRQLINQQSRLELSLKKQEARLVSEGGTYSARRPIMKERLETLRLEIAQIDNQMRDLCTDLLPFTLAPEMCKALSVRLGREAEYHRYQVAGSFWGQQLEQIQSILEGENIWKGLRVSPTGRKTVARRLKQKLQRAQLQTQSTQNGIIHHLAEPEEQQLQEWIAQTLNMIPSRVQACGERLRNLQDERHRIEQDLKRAPDDETLVPIHSEITRLEIELAQVKQENLAVSEKIGATEYQHNEYKKNLEKAVDQLQTLQDAERQVELARTSQLVLREYKEALVQQQLADLQKALVTAFNTICRKDSLLTAAHIDPQDFHVHLQNSNGHIMPVGEFSAGERQLYVLALLHALRQVSGRRLPLAIDTPLARLDEVHRVRFVNDYIPHVSEQVLLFTTDSELDDNMLAEVEPYLARVYRLSFDPQGQETKVVREEHQPQR